MSHNMRRSFHEQNPRFQSEPTVNDLKKHIKYNEDHFGSADARDYSDLIDRMELDARREKAEKEYWGR